MRPLGVAALDRVDPRRLSLRASRAAWRGLREAECDDRAEAHIARPTVQGETEDPGARAASAHLQVETGAIGIVAGLFGAAGLFRASSLLMS